MLAIALAWFGESSYQNVGTAWIDGPGDARIRGDTWVKSDVWDESVVFEYTEVAPDGTETPIGEGPNSLDIARATLRTGRSGGAGRAPHDLPPPSGRRMEFFPGR